MAGVLFEPGALLDVLRGLAHPRDVAHEHGRAVLIGDHRVQVVLRVLDLIVGIDRVVELRTVEVALRLADVDVREQRAHVVDVEAVAGQLLRVRLDADRRHIAAGGRHQAHARHLGNLRGEPVVGDILQLGERHRIGRDRQRQDRLVGRIDLGVDRRRGQAASAASCWPR